jgi:hypothetical protein
MLRAPVAICVLCGFAVLASACAASHKSAGPASHAPAWLRSLARREATLMTDRHPQRIRLRVGVPNKPPFYAGGHEDVIELWGRFTCSPLHGCHLIASCGPSPIPPGQHKARHTHNFCTFRGKYARLDVSPSTHQIMGFELRPHA